MNSSLGKVVSAVMVDENEQDYFVQPDRNGQTYRLNICWHLTITESW